jgi:hypothetical protein
MGISTTRDTDVSQLIKKVQGRLWSVHSASCSIDLILYDVLTRIWKRQDVINITTSYIILHNMIIKDEKNQANIHIGLNVNPRASMPPEVSTQVNPCFQDVVRRNSEIQDKAKHIAIKKDLVEHI